MLPSFCKDVVTVVRPGSKVLRGATVPDWDAATSHEVRGCSVQPASSATVMGDQRVNAVQSGATLYAPPAADVAAGDRVEFEGRAWSVDGEPQAWRSPTGRVSHVIVSLRDWRG